MISAGVESLAGAHALNNTDMGVTGVMIVTRGDLHPPDHGAAIKILRTACAISMNGPPVYLVTPNRHRYTAFISGEDRVLEFPLWTRLLGPWQRLLYRRIARLGVPLDETFLYAALLDWGLLLRCTQVARTHRVRIFHAEFPAYGKIAARLRDALGGIALLVEHNIEFKRILAQHADLGRRAADFLRRTELSVCHAVDQVVTVSEVDRALLLASGIAPGKVRVVPHGVDLGAFSDAQPALDELKALGVPLDRPLLVFHGAYQYPPNLEAMQILANEILPELEKRCSQRVAVIAVGPNPPASSMHPDIFFTGSVPAVPPYLSAAHAAIVPLRRGGGTRMKILDYFAAGVPVVATPKALEGIEVTDGQEALIRESPAELATALAQLLEQPERGDALAAAAKRYVNRYDWLSIGALYRSIYSEAIQD